MKTGIKGAVLFVIVIAIAAGCAPTNVQQQGMTLTQLPRPDLIMVYDFAVSPDEVKLDTGLSAELMQKYAQYKGASPTAQEIKLGHKVAEAVADELVKKIRSYGLWADRGFGYPCQRAQALQCDAHDLFPGALSVTIKSISS